MNAIKADAKVNGLNLKITDLESQNQDLKDKLRDIEKENASKNNKILGAKLGKEELSRKLQDAEDKLYKCQSELSELQTRFTNHLSSSKAVEDSLHACISDLKTEC